MCFILDQHLLFNVIAYVQQIPREYEYNAYIPCPECGKQFVSGKRALKHYNRLSCVSIKELGKQCYLSTANAMQYSSKLKRVMIQKIDPFIMVTENTKLSRNKIRNIVTQSITIRGDLFGKHNPHIYKEKRVRQMNLLNELSKRSSSPILPDYLFIISNPISIDLTDIKNRRDISKYVDEIIKKYGTSKATKTMTAPIGLLSE